MRLVEDPERIVRGNIAKQSTATMKGNVGKIHPKEREENMSEAISSMAQAMETVEAAIDQKTESAYQALSKRKGTDSFATVTNVSKVAKHAMNLALERLCKCAIDVATHAIIDTLKNCSSNRNTGLVCRTIQSALEELLASILQDGSRIHGAF